MLLRLIRLLLVSLICSTNAAHGQDRALRTGTWRVEFDNDLFFNSDNKFTSGISVQRHSNLAATWDDVQTPRWTKFGRNLPGLGAAGLNRRVSISFGQNLQTPDDLEATEPIVDDVPYAAALGAELGWKVFNDDVFRGYALVAGVIGPLAGGKEVQDFVHAFGHSSKARGWDNQLPNELVVNFNGMFKKKLGRIGNPRRWSADLAIDGDFGIGTALVFAEAALEVRAGFNVPPGFAFVPDPIGRTLAHDATLIASDPPGASVYLSIVQRAVVMPYFVFLDGNLFRDSPSIDKETTIAQLITGVHIRWRRWTVHLSSWQASNSIHAPRTPDPSNDFGTIAIDWKF